ncbi:Bifunctional protein: zinc-containing alcohol dehydrogenase; quinone oxidoreductase (NADPH:quinone reductase); Similar to arginate lyase [[Actinomadura] parvosata subsp. kistnae]|uniref:Zinc-binding oxidoreductase n=1 Tax=[Actinomadura] parvosata subsp. kistnae TaxID=1909395 RepID=A0A1U9ZZH2_9ACTN|nr:NADP-dependent oxidoreductase [Nonomuraea sp. ATCC 55076]AQZ63356.1 zinc-binding oxidoreductase [Nonomuraea sp. ATCC 55076]SPL99066.1 Bifunctional protein: zinc-containing alcohol dehydrogenase; quinone oxidoreductase (NADPH:quinone reductase); Similar to arginate lyase [Actinomadura parvosata subsp. kistnae]
MKALQYTAYGRGPVVNEVPEPVPGPGEVLVRVAGAALNPLDVKIGAGHVQEYFPITFPSTVGTDLAGTVERLGSGVTGWSVGDAVIARTDPTAGGAVAEYAVVPATSLVAAPATIPLDAAAGLATAAATAWQAVTEVAQLRSGQKVLVHAGAGGVGSFVIQLARRAGAHVVTTVSGAAAGIVRKLGAGEIIDYTSVDFRTAVSEVDVVVDPVGGETEARSLDVLKPGGLLVSLPVPPDFERAAARGLRAEFVFHASDAERLAKVVAVANEGLDIVVDRTVRLSGAADAFDHLAQGHAKGKVIVRP